MSWMKRALPSGMPFLCALLLLTYRSDSADAQPPEPTGPASPEDIRPAEPAEDKPAEEKGAPPKRLPPAPFAEDDKRALRKIARRLPEHGVLPLAAPSSKASDEDWHRFARKLLNTFAPDSLKSADRRVLLDARPLAPVIESLIPSHRRYVALQALLELYATRMGLAPAPIPESPYKVRVGVTAPEVALLRDRLRVEGYGDEGVNGRLRNYFDDRLKRALQSWQRDNGLPMTSLIDPLTRRKLNAPIVLPVDEVALALARYRSIDLRRDEGRHIIVHVNAFTLVAEQDGRPELTMPVVVGRDTDKDQTPMLSTSLRSLIINPSWVVPQRIIDERLRPEVKDIPELLIDKGYSVQIDDSGRWRVRMGPGPENPLGRFKFLLEDTNGVYLHDTNARSAFSQDARALSAGCVRLLDPMALARWVLPESSTAIEEAAARTTSTSFETENVQVHLVYQTALAEDGRLVRHKDIYSRDAVLLAELDPVALASARRDVSEER
jgi:murein L,D-transpeptidase YcbB/YkuD